MLYEYRHLSRVHRQNSRKFKRIIFFILIIILLSSWFFVSRRENSQTANIISPLADSVNSSINAVKKFIGKGELEKIVTTTIGSVPGTYAVVVKNLKTGEEFKFNSDKKFESASLYKLWVMAVVYKQIETRKLKADKVIKADVKDLNEAFRIATEEAELAEGGIEMGIESAVKQMITISHNYAALALTKEVGLSNVQRFLKEEGFADSRTDPPITTAQDIALYFEKLYKGDLANEEYTQKMIDVLKGQKLNDRLPKYLPAKTKAAHKTGELNGFKHDGGIVFSEKGDYILVILSETEDPRTAAENQAQLSKKIFEYFEK